MNYTVALYTKTEDVLALPLIMAKNGFNPVIIKDKKILLDYLKQDVIHLLILSLDASLDDEMPFIERVVAKKNSAMPLVIISTKSSADALRKAMRMGVRYFLTRPFDELELVASVKEGLFQYKLTRENELLLKSLRKKVHQLKMINEVSKTLNSTIKLDEILLKLMEKVGDLVEAEGWSLLMYSKEKNTLDFKFVIGEKSKQLMGMSIPYGTGIVGWAGENKKSVLVKDTRQDNRFFKGVDEKVEFSTRSVICVPIVYHNELLGVVEVVNKKNERFFTEDDMKIVEILVEQAAVAIQNTYLLEKTYSLTLLDHLTGLFNFRKLHLVMDKFVETETSFAFLFMDLDNFKAINDTHGHKYGSAALIEFANVLRSFITANDYAFRYGGDEFIVLLRERSINEANTVAEKILKYMKTHTFLNKDKINAQLGVSIGVSHFPMLAKEPMNVQYQADTAMYSVKKSGKMGVKVFSVDK